MYWKSTKKINKFLDKSTNPRKSATSLDVSPCGACRPWIFFINGVFFFLKMNDSGMEKVDD